VIERSRLGALRIALIAVFVLTPGLARAQVFGQYTGATPLDPNRHLFGAYLHASDSLLGAMGQLRLSFYPGIDFGFQGGLAQLHLSEGDRTTIRFGTDIKAAVAKPGASTPFAVAMGVGLGVEVSDQLSSITLAPSAVASQDCVLGGTVNVTPYAGAAIAFTRRSLDSHDENDVTLPVRLGSEVDLGSSARFVFELQLLFGNDFGDSYQIVSGVHFAF
jgi:hypothetical protein